MSEVMSKTEQFFEKNLKTIIIAIIAILVVVFAIFGIHRMQVNRNSKANEAAFAAEQYFAQGDYNTALNGNDRHDGLLQIIDRYGNTKVGQRAKYEAGICYLNLGQFEDAIKYLKSYKGKDEITKSEAVICQGDAELELGNTKQAINLYEKAAGMSDNFITTPCALWKAGMAYLMDGNNEKALDCFKKIKTNYPESSEYSTVDKYIGLAETK
ncbi:MAG: tetratricopeptide repeat protein [Bacteroidales bacterium]|nr:tetratricopeptide repeat protein [Bacteroidales bacterium]